MFKKFLIISLLIPAYSFSLDPEVLILTQQCEQRLISTINARYSDRNSSCVWGLIQGRLGCRFLIGFNDSKIKMGSESRCIAGLLGVFFVSRSLLNLANIVEMRRRIDRDSQVLSKVQAGLRNLKALPSSEVLSSNNASR